MFYRALPDDAVAKQLASLINSNNGLQLKRSAPELLGGKTRYLVETHGSLVLGAVGFEKINFSLTEIKHLVIHPTWRKRGLGKFLAKRALSLCDTPLVYVTIRASNAGSLSIFQGLGFRSTVEYPAIGSGVLFLVRVTPQWESLHHSTGMKYVQE